MEHHNLPQKPLSAIVDIVGTMEPGGDIHLTANATSSPALMLPRQCHTYARIYVIALDAVVQVVTIRVTSTTRYSHLTFTFVLGSPEKLCVLVIVTRNLVGDSTRGELLS